MFTFLMLHERCMNDYRARANMAIVKMNRQRLCRMRAGPNAWIIPRPAESWFEIHYNNATIPQE